MGKKFSFQAAPTFPCPQGWASRQLKDQSYIDEDHCEETLKLPQAYNAVAAVPTFQMGGVYQMMDTSVIWAKGTGRKKGLMCSVHFTTVTCNLYCHPQKDHNGLTLQRPKGHRAPTFKLRLCIGHSRNETPNWSHLRVWRKVQHLGRSWPRPP